MKSPLYWYPLLYHLVIRILYGKDLQRRYQIVSEAVGSFSVLDVCCGDCFLAEYLEKRKYYGIDINQTFINDAKKRGLRVALVDVTKDDWPTAECVVILGSLYQFIPEHEEILTKAFQVAQKRVIISESKYSLAESKNPFIAWLARNFTYSGTNCSKQRFNGSSLMALYQKYNAVKIIDAGRDLVGVFDVNDATSPK